MNLTDTLAELFGTRGAAHYGKEPVSQLQHALQSACLAESEGAGASLIVAALLHDIGHLLGPGNEHLVAQGVDARHEISGAKFLDRWLGPAVSEPVRLHVQAKSYLCAVEPEYYNGLSQGSRDSLVVQGGMFNPEQVERFSREPFFEEAVRLRKWDDRAKDPGAETPDLEHYLTRVAELAGGR